MPDKANKNVRTSFTVAVSIVLITVKGIDASLAGFALSFAIQYATTIIWVLRAYANIEIDMVSLCSWLPSGLHNNPTVIL